MSVKKDQPHKDEEIKAIVLGNGLKDLITALSQCEAEGALKNFLHDLCTPQELEALSERWQIARLLALGGISYREISTLTGASTTTIGRVARFLEKEPHKGYKYILEKQKA